MYRTTLLFNLEGLEMKFNGSLNLLNCVVCILLTFLVACGTNTGTSNGDARKVSGKINNYKSGEQDLFLVLDLFSEDTLLVGSIKPDGDFSFEYPSTISSSHLQNITEILNDFQPTTCLDIDNKEVNYIVTGLILIGDGAAGILMQASSQEMAEAVIGSPIKNLGGEFIAFRFYVDGDVKIKGSCIFEEGDTIRYDLNLKDGWNVVVLTLTDNDGNSKVETKNTSGRWFLVNENAF